MKTAIFGASAGLGRALAEEFAARGDDLFLLASDERDINALAADLSLRHKVKVHTYAVMLGTVPAEAVKKRIVEEIGIPDNLLFPIGVSSKADNGKIPPDLVERLISSNFESVVQLCNVFLDDLKDRPNANIVAIGSVSAVRGRSNNSVYSAVKQGLQTYFEGLRHYLAGSECMTQFYVVGYMKTHMTFGQKLPFPIMLPAQAARVISANLGRDLGAVHLPRWWRVITLAFRLVPWFIFRKLKV